jgi:hypothetical protein
MEWSKGIDVFIFNAAPGCKITCTVPGGDNVTADPGDTWKTGGLEVDSSKTGLGTFTGRFEWKAFQNGNQIANGWNDINSLSGNLKGGTMVDTKYTPAIQVKDLIITYGFYDAGPGLAGLTDRDQFYIAIGHNNNRWMGKVAPRGSSGAGKPFSRMVLPSPHDCGMNSMQNSDYLLQTAGDAVIRTLPAFQLFGLSASVVKLVAPNIVYGLAMTQKDSITTLLAIGARYFEFRPAYLHDDFRINNNVYFQHACIPGIEYGKFLSEVVDFLINNPDEIVVINHRWDGVMEGCKRPDDSILNQMLAKIITDKKATLSVGNLGDITTQTIDQLRQSGKRLIKVKGVDSDSNYDDKANATLNGDSIIQALDKLKPSGDKKKFIYLQCQATASNIKDVLVYSVLAADTATSCLTATKAICDSKTNGWLKNNGAKLNKSEQVTIIGNDFLDMGTTARAIAWTEQRLKD